MPNSNKQPFSPKRSRLVTSFRPSLAKYLAFDPYHPFVMSSAWVLERLGFKLEVQQVGDLKLALWRRAGIQGKKRMSQPRRLIVIPGFGDSPLSWIVPLGINYQGLKNSFDELILFDMPGFGGLLHREKCAPSMDALLGAVMDILDRLKPDVLMGHSLGGWIAGRYAVDCGLGLRPMVKTVGYAGPKHVILGCPSGLAGSAPDKEEFRGLFMKTIEEGFEHMRPHVFAHEPRWLRWIVSRYSDFVRREDSVEFLKSFRDDHDLDEKVSQITAKLDLIWGEKDTLVPTRWNERWKTLVPNAHVHILKGLGHTFQIESPRRTAKILNQILDLSRTSLN